MKDNTTNSGSELELLSGALHEIFANSDENMFIKDSDLVYREATLSVAAAAGLSSALDVIGKLDYDIFPAYLADGYVENDRKVLKSGTPIIGKIMRAADGGTSDKWAQTWKYPITNDAGRIIGIYGYSIDVSSLVSLAEGVPDSSSYFELVNNIPVGIGMIHALSNILHLDYANDGFYQSIHISPSTGSRLLGPGFIDLIFPEDRQHFTEVFLSRDSEGPMQSVSYRVTGDDGMLRWVNSQFKYAYTKNSMAYYYISFTAIEEQKETELRLRNSEDTLRSAINNSDVQYFTYFLASHSIEIYALNDRYAKLPTIWNDYPNSFMNFAGIPEEDQQLYSTMVKEIDDGAAESACTVRIQYQGVLRWLYIHMTSVKDASGEIFKALGYSIDVTDQKKAEERYEQELTNLRQAGQADDSRLTYKGHHNLTQNKVIDYDNLQNAAVPLPPECSYDEACQFFSMVPERQEDKEALNDMFARENLMRKFLLGETHFAMQFRRSANGLIPGWASIVINTFKEPISGDIECFVYTYDITEKILKEQVIYQLTDLGYNDLCFIYTDNGGCTAYVLDEPSGVPACYTTDDYDKTMQRLLAVKLDADIMSEALKALCLENIIRELENKKVFSYSFPATYSGERRYKQCQYSYIDDSRNTIFFCLNDITLQYKTEHKQIEALREAKLEADRANEAKSVFLSGMSHDLRTPLNGIIGFTELALEENDPQVIREYLQKIKYSGDLLLGLVSDTLELSRIESGKMVLEPGPVSASELIDPVLESLQASADLKNIRLETCISGCPAEVFLIDKLKVQKVLLNLMSNAIKFTPRGGTVRFSEECFAAEKNSCRIRITVEDNGIGITSQFLPRLFEPFAQEQRAETKNTAGTGLGLAIVKRIVELMEGTIDVKTSVGEGTCFTVEFPVEIAHAPAETPSEKSLDTAVLAGKRVLLCEDNYLNTDIAVLILSSAGLITECAVNGSEGLQMFKNSQPGYYSAILMDIRMPVMDGYEATRSIRALTRPDAPEIPIIAMTADAFDSDIRKGLKSGLTAYVTKPIDKRKLLQTLTEAIADK